MSTQGLGLGLTSVLGLGLTSAESNLPAIEKESVHYRARSCMSVLHDSVKIGVWSRIRVRVFICKLVLTRRNILLAPDRVRDLATISCTNRHLLELPTTDTS